MLLENLRLLALLFVRPLAAMGGILDRGGIVLSIVLSLLASFLADVPRPAVAALSSDGPPGMSRPSLSQFASSRGSIETLITLAILFAPAIILMAGAGSFGVVMRRDYAALMVCTLMAWTASRLPVFLLSMLTLFAGGGPELLVIARGLGGLYFLVLAVCAVRIVFGAGFGRAVLATTVAGAVALIAGGLGLRIVGSLASPFLLYYAYFYLRDDFQSIGSGLRSRQAFRRHLESATINPRDADAHYQLGLLHLERRQFSEAAARFRRALEIDSTEAEPQFQLGRILREQRKPAEALELLRRAAAINDKLATSEVWREIGAASYELGQYQEALSALEKYVSRREYDPEGLYWYGRTLAALNRPDEARAAFRNAIEAVDTMPSRRRGQVRKWKGAAQQELRALG